MRTLELEVEEADRLPDNQAFMHQAEVSSFVTSAKAPPTLSFLLMHDDLEFSPQSGPSSGPEASSSASHLIPPLQLSVSRTSSASSTCSLSSLWSVRPWDSKKPTPPHSRSGSWSDLSLLLAADETSDNWKHHENSTDFSWSAPQGTIGSLLRPPPAPPTPPTQAPAPPSVLHYPSPSKSQLSVLRPMPPRAAPAPTSVTEHRSVPAFKSDLPPLFMEKKILVTDSDLKLGGSSPPTVSYARQSRRVSTAGIDAYCSNISVGVAMEQQAPELLQTPRFRREKLFPQVDDHHFFPHKTIAKRPAAMQQMKRFLHEHRSNGSTKSHNGNGKRPYAAPPSSNAAFPRKQQAMPSSSSTVRIHGPTRWPTHSTINRASVAAPSFPRNYEGPVLAPSWAKPTKMAVMPSISNQRVRLAQRMHEMVSPAPVIAPPPKRKIGAYSPEARRERLRRFHEKRKLRVFHKRIKYACRERLANACPRIKGRFVKKTPASMETVEPCAVTATA